MISENSTSGGGGGVDCYDSGLLTLTDCVISGNSSHGLGGGVYCGQNSSMTMTDCVINGNSAEADGGGGVACWYGAITMTRCSVVGNTAQEWFGGGVYAGHSSATLINCLIARNTAPMGGGGVACSYPETSVTIRNCTIWGNSGEALLYGGGGVLCREASATVTNSILWGNTAPKGREISVQDPASTLSIVYSNVAGSQTDVSVEGGCTLDWGEGNIDIDPRFTRLGYLDDKGTRDPSDDVWVEGDFHLKSQAGRWDSESQTWVQDDVTSPCIDAGNSMSPIGWESFPNGGFVNMGAYAGTPEASRTFFGKPICDTIVAGDINGDCHVNRTDLEIMALHWTDEEPLLLP